MRAPRRAKCCVVVGAETCTISRARVKGSNDTRTDFIMLYILKVSIGVISVEPSSGPGGEAGAGGVGLAEASADIVLV